MDTLNTENNDIVISSTINDMVSISEDSLASLKVSNSTDTINQLRMFLVAQAKNELRRIVKLTKYLDIVEDKFIETSAMLMSEYPDNMDIISGVMKALTACINRSNELITQVVSDDKLNSYIFNKEIIEDTESPKISLESRNKIREIANKILNQLDSEGNGDE